MNIRTMTMLSLLSFGVLACSGSDKDSVDSGTSGGTDSGSGGGDEGGGESGGGNSDGISPSILSADSWCYEHPKSDATYIWMAAAEVTDPQGLDTLESFFDGVVVSTSGVEVATYAMVCTSGGDCSTSWNQNEDGIACSNAEAYEIQITVVDEDGNWSESVQVTGRVGSSAEG